MLENSEKIDFTINDFVSNNNSENWKGFVLKKDCIICSKSFGKEPFDKEVLQLSIHKSIEISKSIMEINKYLKWLGGDCKDILINGLCEHINEFDSITIEELIDKKWYEELEIYRVIITVTENGKIGANISFGDNYSEDHILDIDLLEDQIIEIGYDG
jgi:hypothetical protein